MVTKLMPTLLDEIEVGEILKWPPFMVLDLANRDSIPHLQLDKNEVRFDREDLLRWLQSRKRGPKFGDQERST